MSDSENHWHALRLTVLPEAIEAIEFAFNSLDALGTETELIRRTSSEVSVNAYFDQMPSDESIQDEIHYALQSYGLGDNAIISIERKVVENSDWLAEWKKYWKPTAIGNFVIAAPWHEVEESQKIVIRIEPNMAFGTGTHETTQLCLKAIEELYRAGNSFLDVGTGTGILSIAAALKCRNTNSSECARLGVDTDGDAITIAKENAQLNGVAKIEFQVASINENTSTFDFVCANLTLDVILPILPLLLGKAKKHLVLSGILKTQEQTIENELKKLGAADYRIETAGEWIAVVVTK